MISFNNCVTAADLSLQFAPWRLTGTAFGAALNDPDMLAALGDAAHAPPYKAPPRAPVLFVKPRNTLRFSGSAVPWRHDIAGWDVGATLGLVIGRTACKVAVDGALGAVAGWAVVADLSAPYDSHYRPAARFRARDGSCCIAPPVAVPVGADPGAVTLNVSVDGHLHSAVSMAGLVRPAAQLIADVSEFMTLHPGDLLLLGTRHGAPRLKAGQGFSIDGGVAGRLEGRIGMSDEARA